MSEHQRLGQLIANTLDAESPDLFYIEDEKLRETVGRFGFLRLVPPDVLLFTLDLLNRAELYPGAIFEHAVDLHEEMQKLYWEEQDRRLKEADHKKEGGEG